MVDCVKKAVCQRLVLLQAMEYLEGHRAVTVQFSKCVFRVVLEPG